MTNKKSQVAVKLTAEDIENYFVNNADNYNPLIDFLFDFRPRGFTLNDFKFRKVSKNDREYIVMIMDNKGVEHECTLIDTFIDNLDTILTDPFPEGVFNDLVDAETEGEINFYKTCTLNDLEEFIQHGHISGFRRVFLPPYGEYYPILHLLENPNKNVIEWVIKNDPYYDLTCFLDGDKEIEDPSICWFINRNQKNPELREMLLEHYKGQ